MRNQWGTRVGGARWCSVAGVAHCLQGPGTCNDHTGTMSIDHGTTTKRDTILTEKEEVWRYRWAAFRTHHTHITHTSHTHHTHTTHTNNTQNQRHFCGHESSQHAGRRHAMAPTLAVARRMCEASSRAANAETALPRYTLAPTGYHLGLRQHLCNNEVASKEERCDETPALTMYPHARLAAQSSATVLPPPPIQQKCGRSSVCTLPPFAEVV